MTDVPKLREGMANKDAQITNKMQYVLLGSKIFF
jgi:hypothetical protein